MNSETNDKKNQRQSDPSSKDSYRQGQNPDRPASDLDSDSKMQSEK